LLRNTHTESLGRGQTLVRLKQRKRGMRFCTWNVRSLYRAGSLTAAVRELEEYKVDLVGVQEVRWEKGITVRAGNCNFFYGKGNENHQFGTGFFVHHRVVSTAKTVEFISDRLSYIVLRGRWSNIIVQNVHATSEEKRMIKGQICEELEQVFDHFLKCHMNILLGDFNGEVERENIFKLTVGNENLRRNGNDDGVRIMNFATSKNLVVKSTIFSHRNLLTYT